MTVEKKIYSKWAYTENESEKAAMNRLIYEELKEANPDFKFKLVERGYAQKTYKVLENPNNLSIEQMALLIDSGNLCFGYRCSSGNIVIYTD